MCISTCYWCLKIKEVAFQDGFWFCSDDCEDAYYNDRQNRRMKNLPPLFFDRRISNSRAVQ